MDTERHILYSILNGVRDAEHNNDEPVTESLLRNLIYTYRADSIRKHYRDGQTVSDEVFQRVPLKLLRLVDGTFVAQMPKIIRFTNNYGMYIEKFGTTIPIVTSQEFSLGRNNPFNRKFPHCKSEGNQLILRVPDSLQGLDQVGENYQVIKDFLDSIAAQELFNFNNPSMAKDVEINLDLRAVLSNPTDCEEYDWEVDIFPFPQERLPELRSQIMLKEFGIMKESKKDEVQNARADVIRYHDNGDVR